MKQVAEYIIPIIQDGKNCVPDFLQAKELIRCKDCKHRDPEDKKCDCGHSIRWQLPRSDGWFCADAERKETS